MKRWGRALLFGLVVMVIVIGVRAFHAGPGDLEDLDRFQRFLVSDVGPESEWFAAGLSGDGAMFAAIAADPFGKGPANSIFYPAYRYARAGYGWMASLVVLGYPPLVLLGLSGVGMAMVFANAAFAFLLRETRGPWAWALILNPGLLLGAIGDTSEPLASLLLALAIGTGSILATVLLGITRVSYGVGLASRWRQLFLVGVVGVVFKGYWSWHFGESFFSGGWTLGIPFAGILSTPTIPGILVVGAGLVTMVIGVRRADLGWVVAGLLVVSLTAPVLDGPVSAFRSSGLLPVLWAFGPRFEPRPMRCLVNPSLPVSTASYPER